MVVLFCSDGISQVHKRVDFEVKKVHHLNTEFAEFSPTYWEGYFVFTSDREYDFKNAGEANWHHIKRLNLFKMDKSSFDGDSIYFDHIHILDNAFVSDDHSGPISFTADGKYAYYSETSHEGAKLFGKNEYRPQLYQMELVEGKWKNKKKLPFQESKYSYAQPSVSPDGDVIYFASDCEGGRGGKDIYFSKLVNGEWNQPESVEYVDSEEDEVFPYFHGDVLYFSRESKDGFGGLDLYRCRLKDGEWQEPENLGPTINSDKDDFGFILDPSGLTGYFSSNRDGGEGSDDIYFFNRIESVVLETETLAGKFEYKYLKDKNAGGLDVVLLDEDGNIIMRTKTNSEGEFEFKNLPSDLSYSIRLMDDGEEVVLTLFGKDSDAFLLRDENGAFIYRRLNSDKAGTMSLIPEEDIDLDMNMADLHGQFVYRELTGHPEGMEVFLVDEDGNIVRRVKTDKYGNFEFKDLPMDKNYMIKLDNGENIDLIIFNKKNEVVAVMAADGSGTFLYRKLASEAITGMEVLEVDEGELEFSKYYKHAKDGYTYRSLESDDPGVVPFEIYDEDGNLVFRGFTDENGYFKYSDLPMLKDMMYKLEGDSSYFSDSLGLVIVSRSHDVFIVMDKDNKGFFVYRKLKTDSNGMVAMTAEDEGELQIVKPWGASSGGGKPSSKPNVQGRDYSRVDKLEPDKVESGLIRSIPYDRMSYKLSWLDSANLEQVAIVLKARKDLSVRVEAFSSSPGDDEYNMRISKKRMRGVVKFLLANGVSESRIKGDYYGEKKLINDCDDSIDCKRKLHALNRRVELKFINNRSKTVRF